MRERLRKKVRNDNQQGEHKIYDTFRKIVEATFRKCPFQDLHAYRKRR